MHINRTESQNTANRIWVPGFPVVCYATDIVSHGLVDELYQAESLSTLVFASRCMRVRSKPVAHEERETMEVTLRQGNGKKRCRCLHMAFFTRFAYILVWVVYVCTVCITVDFRIRFQLRS